MNAETYEKLLSELGIPSEWSAENKEALLDEKYSEALELLDVAQQNGEEDKIAQLDDKIKKMEDALEYTKEIAKRLSSGLVLNTQSDKDRLKELKETGKKEETQTVKQFETAPLPTANTPAPQPQVSSNNANSLLQSKMRRAKMELEDEHWRQARQLYDDILNTEPENAEANLGLFMAEQNISEEKNIPEAARNAMKDNRDIFQDKRFLRTLRYADDSLKKELESYEKGRDYLIAIEALQRANTNEDYQRVSEMFDQLGDFADSRKQKEECDRRWKKPLYDATMQAIKYARTIGDFAMVKNNLDKLGDYEDARELGKMAAYQGAKCYMADARNMKDVSQFSTAKEIFEKLGDYSDSRDKIEECEAGIKQLQGQEESYKEYKQEYEKFEKQVVNLQEIRQHASQIASQQAKIDSLKKKGAGNPIESLWIFLIGGLGLLGYFVSAMAKWRELVSVFLNVVLEPLAVLIDHDTPGYWVTVLERYDKTATSIVKLVFLMTFLIPFVCWVRHHMEEDFDDFLPACFKALWKAVLIFIITNLIIIIGMEKLFLTNDIFAERAQSIGSLIGSVALIIAVAMIVKNIIVKIMYDRGLKEIRQLEWSIGDDYENIRKIIDMEYQKIYDRYPDAGSDREAVSEVQSRLMDNIKKRNGAG